MMFYDMAWICAKLQAGLFGFYVFNVTACVFNSCF